MDIQTTSKAGSALGNPSWLRRRQYAWVRAPWLDYVTALPIALLLVTGVIFDFIPVLLVESGVAERRVFFQAVATLAGTTAGLTLTSVSILINLVRTPIGVLEKVLEQGDKRRVGSVFLAVLPKLALTTVAALSAVLLDELWAGEPQQMWLDYVVIWLATASLLALARVVWVLRRLLDLSM